MRLLTGEVAPLAPLLIPLGEVLIWAVGFALCLLCVYLAKALFGAADSAVGWIPWLGKIVTKPLTSIEQKIVSFMSQAAATSDAKMGAAFHELARVIDWIGEEINRHANLIELLAGILAGTAGLSALQQAIAQLFRHSKAVQATATHALETAIALPRTIQHGIGEDVLPRIKSLEHTVGGVIAHDLPGLRSADRILFRGIDDLRKWVHHHTLEAGTLAFAGAVAVALGRLGLGGLRCNNFTNMLKKRGCGLGLLVDRLLELAVFLTIAFDFKLFVDASMLVARGIGDTVAGIEGVFELELPPLPPPNR